MYRTFVLSIILATSMAVSAAFSSDLPKLAVVSIDFDGFVPDGDIMKAAGDKMEESGRFDVVELGEDAFLLTSPALLLDSLKNLASRYDLDVVMALEFLDPDTTERTVSIDDSLVTMVKIDVEVLGRFYSSSGHLIGTLDHVVEREGRSPFSIDVHEMARRAAGMLADRALMEIFPLQLTFTASDRRVFTIPIGATVGLEKGTVMTVMAVARDIPDDPSEYETLKSRGLMQVMRVSGGTARARLISGYLVNGGTVVAVEHSAPATLYMEYGGMWTSLEMGEGLESDGEALMGCLRVGVGTAKWGPALRGGIRAGGLEHSSMVGVELLGGLRIPLRSPELGLRLEAGGDLLFHMQAVRSPEVVSDASAVTVAAVADVILEYLFSHHLGLQSGVAGIFGGRASSWTVQDATGQIREALPDEIYHTSIGHGPLEVHAGLFYLIF